MLRHECFWCVCVCVCVCGFFFIAAVVVSSTQRILPCCPYFVKTGGSPEDINLTGEEEEEGKKKDFPEIPSLLQMNYLICQYDIIIILTAHTVHLQ